MAERETNPENLGQALLPLAGTVLIVGFVALMWSNWGKAPNTSAGAVKAPAESAASTPESMAGPKFELIIGPRPGSRDDGMTGTHALRTKAITLPDGRSLIVGCVPCLNALTYIAVMNGHAYAVNGYAQDLAKRYSVRSGGKTMAVHDLDQDDSTEAVVQTPVFAAIEVDQGMRGSPHRRPRARDCRCGAGKPMPRQVMLTAAWRERADWRPSRRVVRLPTTA